LPGYFARSAVSPLAIAARDGHTVEALVMTPHDLRRAADLHAGRCLTLDDTGEFNLV
jgi:hypothetical protein